VLTAGTSVAASLAVTSLLGSACGDDDDDAAPTAGATGASTAGATATTATAKVGGELTYAAVLEPVDANPITSTLGQEHEYHWMLHDNLVSFDGKASLDANRSLAEKWEVKSPTEISFTLRKGVKFANGETLTSEDVKYCFDLVLNPDTKSAARGDLSSIDTVSTPDPQTVVLKLKTPSASLLTLLGDRAGMIVSKKALAAGLKEYSSKPNGGSGPFRLDSWTPKERWSVSRNPEYWRKDGTATLPYLNKLTARFISDPAVQLASMQSGEIQLTSLSAADKPKYSSFNTTDFKGAAAVTTWIDSTIGPTNDVRVRQALAYAYDRKTLSEVLTGGVEPPAIGVITPVQWAYDEKLPAPSFDLAKAKQLISQAGIASGTKIKAFSLSSELAKRRAELAQSMLKQIGIDMEITLGDASQLVPTLLAHTHNLAFASMSMRADPHGIMGLTLRSGGTLAPGIPAAPDVDAGIDKANQTYDQAERKKLYYDVQDLINNKYCMHIWETYQVSILASAKKLAGMDTIFGGEGKLRFPQLWVNA
jgi:peptide/nickel transport system substrate-binding protein